MKITIYTTTDCQYSKQEKDFLKLNNLPFEEKNLETNKDYLTEMLAISNNFAGTPVTKIEKDDGQVVVLKGFTREEFNKTLGLTPVPEPTTPTPPTPNPTPPPPAEPSPTTPTEPSPPSTPVETPPTPPVPEPPPEVPPVIEPPGSDAAPKAPATVQDAQLNSILNDLQSKLGESPTTDKQPVVSSAPPVVPPVIPDPGFK